MTRFSLGLKALRQLGIRQVGLYALYQLGLRSGYYRRVTPPPRPSAGELSLSHFYPLPQVTALQAILGAAGQQAIVAEADEILAGKVRLFGGPPVPLELALAPPLAHWTEYESGHASYDQPDVKLTWEPARFGWAFKLCRAYHLTKNEAYAQAFWQHFAAFQAANPPYCGPNWVSAQEAALRIPALVFAGTLLADSPHSTPASQAQLVHAIAGHAGRIPPTLVYARAQNNNHLVSEALGLYTAAAALPGHPQAPRWQQLGWRWLNHAFQTQIAADGTYTQHSTNYHRLMLQAALWAYTVQQSAFPSQPFPAQTLSRLQAGVSWLLSLLDPLSGQVPNLGPNDGAYIFPFNTGDYYDARPVLQAAALAFLGTPALEAGIWDEMSLWFGLPPRRQPAAHPAQRLAHPTQTTLQGGLGSWAYLRLARFTSRPGHADQLHLDLWWRGLNIALDPGTCFYNAPPAWDNALATSLVHNTLSVDGLEQMTRAGRFLYLDWAQAERVERETASDGSWQRLSGSHNGYRRLGIRHTRRVTAWQDGRWLVEDRLSGPARPARTARVHWLLPDWPWHLSQAGSRLQLGLDSPLGPLRLTFQAGSGEPGSAPLPLELALVRCGERLAGSLPVQPTWGWTSPAYSVKNPALAVILTTRSTLPLYLSTEWSLKDEKS